MVLEAGSATPPPLPGLGGFCLDRLLFEDPKSKTVAVAGHFHDDEAHTAVVIAEKTPLSHDGLAQLFHPHTKISTSTHNSIYSQLEASCGGCLGDLHLTTIYPATEAHILKYSQQTCHVIHETPEDYAAITKPFIQSQSFDIQVNNDSQGLIAHLESHFLIFIVTV